MGLSRTASTDESRSQSSFSSGFPIAGATFTQDGFLLQKIAASNVGTLGLVLVLLIRLYSGWGYAGSRLKSKVIEYEGKHFYPRPRMRSVIRLFSHSQHFYSAVL